MKILCFGDFSTNWQSESEISRALDRLGHEVVCLGEHGANAAKLVAVCAAEKPEILFGFKFRFGGDDQLNGQLAAMLVKTLDRCRPHVGKIIAWQFDPLMPEFSRDRWQWAQALAPAIDVFAATDGAAIERLPNGFWLRQGSSDLVDHEAAWSTEFAGDVLFVGSKYRSRIELVDGLRARFGPRFRIVPDLRIQEREIRGRALTALCRSYRVCVCPVTPVWRRYWSNRNVSLAGHGALIASPVVDGMADDGWVPGVNFLPMPGTAAAYCAQLAEYLERSDDDLRAIRLAGYTLALKLSYDYRMVELLSHFEAHAAPSGGASDGDSSSASSLASASIAGPKSNDKSECLPSIGASE